MVSGGERVEQAGGCAGCDQPGGVEAAPQADAERDERRDRGKRVDHRGGGEADERPDHQPDGGRGDPGRGGSRGQMSACPGNDASRQIGTLFAPGELHRLS